MAEVQKQPEVQDNRSITDKLLDWAKSSLADATDYLSKNTPWDVAKDLVDAAKWIKGNDNRRIN